MLTGITGVIIGVGSGAIAPLPAGAAPAPLELEMVPGSGELLIRDAEEPFSLGSPTTVTGTIDEDGTITGTTFSTPSFSFQQPVLGGQLTADVDATFTQLSLGAGLLNGEGSLSLSAALRADLHIEVDAAGISADCVTSPVNLELVSTAPYSETTNLVPVADADFTIPPVQVTPTCDKLVADNVNESLAGSGHAIELTLEGEMELPSLGTTASATSLTVSPVGTAALGQEVTMTATVASADAQQTAVPTGLVSFRDGDEEIALVALTDGVATLATSGLGLGVHELTAVYRGDTIYARSTSTPPVSLTVQADPVVIAEIPGVMNIGAAPAEFDVVVDNPSVGRDVANVRVDLTVARYDVTGQSFDPLDPDDVLIEVRGDGGTWNPVVLTSVPGAPLPAVVGTLGPELGRALAAGEALTDRVRISFPSGNPETTPGALDVTFDVVEVVPASGEIVKELSSTTGRLNLFLPGRIPSELYLAENIGPIGPMTVRQHGTLATSVGIGPALGFATYPTGTLRVRIDGQAVSFFATNPGDLSQPNQMTAPIDYSGVNELLVPLPPTIAPGSHTFTVEYSGNEQFTPSTQSTTFTVVEPIGVPYECEMPVFGQNRRFTAQVRAGGRLPSTARDGSTLSISDFELDLFGSLNVLTYYAFDIFARAQDRAISLDFGPEGSGSATDVEITPSSFPFGSEPGPDVAVALTEETASVVIDGAPGAGVVPTLDKITLASSDLARQDIECVPVDQPVSFGAVTVAGTTLAVEAPTPARADDDVTLRASVFPSTATGTVRFYDGDELLDIAPVSAGQAVTTVQLPEGEHSLSARFLAGASAPSTTSDEVPLTVRSAIECDGTADAGNGAAVRLVYLELLRRCPEPDGYVYWTDALDDGDVDRVEFAQQISKSLEARMIIVDDAYELMLGRAAEADGRLFWARRLSNGRFDTLLADLGASPEFRELAGSTNEGFINRVYERILDRPADPDGRSYWMYQLNRGVSPRQLVLTLANLTEPLGVMVDAAYDELLGRAPTAAERQAGITLMRARSNRSALYASIIGTGDFFTRAQSFPNPED